MKQDVNISQSKYDTISRSPQNNSETKKIRFVELIDLAVTKLSDSFDGSGLFTVKLDLEARRMICRTTWKTPQDFLFRNINEMYSANRISPAYLTNPEAI